MQTEHSPAAVSGFSLSSQQSRIWRAMADGFAPIAKCVIEVRGEADTNVLTQSLDDLVRANPALTSAYRCVAGLEPLQTPDRTLDPVCHYHDASEIVGRNGDEPVAAAYAAPFPIDIENGPLLRATLLKLSADRHAVVLHIVPLAADRFSLLRLPERLARHYGARIDDRPVPPPEIDYIRFAEWQRELLNDEDAEQGRTFWRGRAAAEATGIVLPYAANRARPPGASGTVAATVTAGSTGVAARAPLESVTVGVAPDVVDHLERAAQAAGAALDTVLLACWQTLLWRLTGQRRITVAATHDGRVYDALADVVGVFAKTLPITTSLSPASTFEQVVRGVERSVREAEDWQEYLTDDPNAAPGSAPRPRIGFEVERRPAPVVAGNLAFALGDVDFAAEPVDLKLRGIRNDGSLRLAVDYDPGLFGADDVGRLAAQLTALLGAAVRAPDRPIGRLRVIGTAERRCRTTAARRPAARPRDNLVERFERQCDLTPERVAVVHGDAHVSFAALRERSNRLARHLRRLGVGAESPVAVAMDRSPDMLVAVFGILKAGGAYLPLEPLPRERAERIVRGARARAMLTTREVARHLPEVDIPRICLDSDWPRVAQESAAAPEVGIDPGQLAYVIHTSGSTGQPKGVMVEHRSAVNLLDALNADVYDALKARTAPDGALRVGLNAPLIFDASVKQIVQLLAGRTLCIVPDEARPDAARLLAFATAHRLDLLDATPTQLRTLMQSAPPVDPVPDTVLIGGEPIDARTWQWLAGQRKQRFFNVYGPTECTVDSTICAIEPFTEPCLGRPIAGSEVHVLDAELEPTPAGLPGEIFIGGAGLSRGYLGDPVLTAQKFVPNPFNAEPGARLYRSGDIAYVDGAGALRFVGRADHQVKLRGFRIELGEVESVLGRHAGVDRCVAVVREDTPGDTRLVAYFVPRRRADATLAAALRDHARGLLPEFMVPSAFVQLETVPQTPNGKVDRDALPAPDRTPVRLEAGYVAPRSDAEKTIARIWMDALNTDKVGVRDNFFDLGGHSLLMVQVHSRLREAFDKELSLVEMFRNPTVQALAAHYTSDGGNLSPSVDASSRGRHRAHLRRQARRRHIHR